MVAPGTGRLFQKRLLCTATSTTTSTTSSSSISRKQQRWSVKEVTKSNFTDSLLHDLNNHIRDSDFIAISTQKTGSFSGPPWRRFLPFLDTPETAYLKAKDAAQRFQLLHFMVCPFSLKPPTPTSNTTLTAHPYNFHLFPRDELNIGMPSYSFSCQTSYLTSMARDGFDFNACIYDGISYLSRAQESTAKHRIGSLISDIRPMKSSSTLSVADKIFAERIKLRVRHWRNACIDKSEDSEEALVKSLRKLLLGGERYGSRPCMSIDVCNEHQVQLVLEILNDFSDDLVPLIIPEKGGLPKSVRAVLTSSEKDKNLLKRELQDLEENQNKKVRGFREVIELISASRKPIVTYNSLNEFPFIHSKFIGPLPPSMNEFICSLRSVFPDILDVNNLLKEIGPLKKARSLPAALSYLKRQFFAPVDMEIPEQAVGNQGKLHRDNALFTAYLFSKLSSILKSTPTRESMTDNHQATSVNDFANIFTPCTTNFQELIDEQNVMINNTRKVSTKQIVFLWGFRRGMPAGVLKRFLCRTHDLFVEEFEVRMVDKSCAIVLFWKPSSAETLLKVMGTEAYGYYPLRELISEGLRAAGYEAYRRVCESGFVETHLADSLDQALAEVPDDIFAANSNKEAYEVHWSSDSVNIHEL